MSTIKVLMDTFINKNTFDPEAAKDIEMVIQHRVVGKDPVEWWIEIKNGTFSINEGVHEHPDTVLVSDSDTYIAIWNGKIRSTKAFIVGKLQVKGSFELVGRLEEVFQIS